MKNDGFFRDKNEINNIANRQFSLIESDTHGIS